MEEIIPFGPFSFLGQVGNSQMVEVWVAGEELADGARRPCVIKRVAPAYKDFAALRKVLQEEAQIASLLNHKGIVCLYGSGEIEGLPYIQLELVDGVALRQIGALFTAPAMTVGPVVELGGRICEALAFAHALTSADGQPLNLVHGKLSPANILLGRGGEVKIADFGVSFAGEQDPRHDLIPSPDRVRYLAPEQVQMGNVDGRADLFALGVVMTELLSGHVLLPNGVMAEADIGALVRQRCQSAPRGVVPEQLVELLISMTSPSPELRPASSNDAMLLLQQAWGGLDAPEYVATYLAREVFVNLPVISGEAVEPPAPASGPTEPEAPARGSLDPKQAMLGAANVPGASLQAMSSGPSYPTTGSILLESHEAPPPELLDPSLLQPVAVPQQAPAPLPTDALSPIVPAGGSAAGPPAIAAPRLQAIPLGHVQVPTAPAEVLPAGRVVPVPVARAHPELAGTYRLGPKGVQLLTAYDPYLVSIGVGAGEGGEAADSTKWEYFLIAGDRAGPRIIRKGLDARFYREQTVTLLEGSKLFAERINQILADSRSLPSGVLSARGGTGALDVGVDENERFLKVHEARQPRPMPRETTDLKRKFLRFLGRQR